MVNSIDDIIELHKDSGMIEDAYIKIHIDEKILNLNLFTMKVTAVKATKEDVEIWNERISKEIRKNKKLEKETKEFSSLFDLLNKIKLRSGKIRKGESPDFIIEKDGKEIGIEVTKIYVGYDWVVEKIESELKEYKIEEKEAEGYIEYKKLGDKVELYNKKGKLNISPKIIPKLNEEYHIKIKNKIFEKIRKQLDDYKKYDYNVIYAEITSPEYFDDITDLDAFSKEISYYIMHLEGDLNIATYMLIIKINQKWIELNLNEGTYKLI